jgi:hypothetical protein
MEGRKRAFNTLGCQPDAFDFGGQSRGILSVNPRSCQIRCCPGSTHAFQRWDSDSRHKEQRRKR